MTPLASTEYYKANTVNDALRSFCHNVQVCRRDVDFCHSSYFIVLSFDGFREGKQRGLAEPSSVDVPLSTAALLISAVSGECATQLTRKCDCFTATSRSNADCFYAYITQ